MKEVIKKRVLITGALGQDGIIISKILKKQNFSVSGLIKKKNFNKKVSGLKYFVNDLKNKKKLKMVIDKINPNFLIHFASINDSHHNKKNNEYNKMYNQNVQMSKNLLDVIIKNNLKTKLIFAGSSQMFKKEKNKIVNEKSKFHSNHFYGKYKIFIHNYLMKLKKKYNLNATTLILFNHDSGFRNKKFLIPRLAIAFKKKNKKFIQKIYKKNIKTDMSHAYDICNAIYLYLKTNKNYDKLVLSSGKLTAVNEIIFYIMKKTKFEIVFENKIKDNKKTLLGNNSKAITCLKWKIKKNIFKAVDEILSN